MRPSGRVSNQAEVGKSQTTGMHRASHGELLQRIEADEGFAVPLIPPAPVLGLTNGAHRQGRSQEGRCQPSSFPTAAAHHLVPS